MLNSNGNGINGSSYSVEQFSIYFMAGEGGGGALRGVF